MVEFSFEEVAVYLPKYLSPNEQKGLYDELKKFDTGNFTFYDQTNQFKDDLLQGDGWQGLMAISFQLLQKKSVSGIIISNSCDIDISNKRDLSPNILFAPLIKLADFEKVLIKNGQSAESIENKIKDIKKQYQTSTFYLPECPGVIEESIILLDDIHRHPLAEFVQTEKSKLFTFSQAAFYLFLIKLSIHFHRIQESVHRYIPEKAA